MQNKPSVGRIVHYYGASGDGPHAAIVTAVHSDTLVSLTVFPDGGLASPQANVVQSDAAYANGFSRWEWPPRS